VLASIRYLFRHVPGLPEGRLLPMMPTRATSWRQRLPGGQRGVASSFWHAALPDPAAQVTDA